MSLEHTHINPSNLPEIIQGGMGVAVSDWRLARAVASEGALGIVSGTAIGLVLARRLQDGDPGGHMQEALAGFPDQDMAGEIIESFYLPNGRSDGRPYKNVPKSEINTPPITEKLNIAGAYAEVMLARQGHNGPVGINLLTKIQLPTMSTLYGAMVAGVDVVAMGAGIPSHIPPILNSLRSGARTNMNIYVHGATSPHEIVFEPSEYPNLLDVSKTRPQFLAIVASHVLARRLAQGESTPDGFIVEGPTAGGHNAPARGKQLGSDGQPVYGPKDEVNLEQLAAKGLPFWLAGSYGSHEGLQIARSLGANGIQVGSAFALCEESGLDPALKRRMVEQVLSDDGIRVFTDPLASPSGFPFKVAQLPGTLSEPCVRDSRKRNCDLGFLQDMQETADGRIEYFCAAEPLSTYERKGKDMASTIGRVCLCNGLTAAVRLGQLRPSGIEPPIVTIGDDVSRLVKLLASNANPSFSAADVIRNIKGL